MHLTRILVAAALVVGASGFVNAAKSNGLTSPATDVSGAKSKKKPKITEKAGKGPKGPNTGTGGPGGSGNE